MTSTLRSIAIDGAAHRRLRAVRRWTAADLGEKTDRCARHLYGIEHGRRAASMEYLDRLAKVVGADAVAELIVDPEDREIFAARYTAHPPAAPAA